MSAPTIGGPYRYWKTDTPIEQDPVFFQDDHVYWWQADDSDSQHGGPGMGIDEAACKWWYQKLDDNGNPEGNLIEIQGIQYHTFQNRRYAFFIFRASTLPSGKYRISCYIPDKEGNVYANAWDVVDVPL